jgi:tetratricopeptide (TPR) repeat protein
VATGHNDLGRVYRDRQEYSRALEEFHAALAIDQKLGGGRSSGKATRLNNIAEVHVAMGDLPLAVEFYAQVLQEEEHAHGPVHPAVATASHNLASLCYKLDLLDRALEYCKTSYTAYLKLYGENDNKTKAVLRLMKLVERDLKRKNNMTPEEYEEWKRRMAELRASRERQDVDKSLWDLQGGEEEEEEEEDLEPKIFSSGQIGKWKGSVFEDEFFEL